MEAAVGFPSQPHPIPYVDMEYYYRSIQDIQTHDGYHIGGNCVAFGVAGFSDHGGIGQVRVGKFGRHFKFYKFRSMYIDAEARKAELLKNNESSDGVIFKMKRDPRITPVGRFIRKFSIDELPQLFNVILGDMSLVGPRPPLPSEVRAYTLEERKRLNITPGITCLWQVSGRSELPFSKQIALDKEYIASRSAFKDFLILLKTIPAILTGKGAW